jgi:hypothetical protein
VFELIRETFELFEAARAWLLSQPLLLQVAAGALALAVLWVLWILLRVILVALRAAFRGL